MCEDHKEDAKWTIKMIEKQIRATEALVDVGFFLKWGPKDVREPLASHGTELKHLRSLAEALHNITRFCKLCEELHFMIGGWNPLSEINGL